MGPVRDLRNMPRQWQQAHRLYHQQLDRTAPHMHDAESAMPLPARQQPAGKVLQHASRLLCSIEYICVSLTLCYGVSCISH